MPITSIKRDFVGDPNIVRIECTDSLVEITTEDYLVEQEPFIEAIQHGTFEWLESDLVCINYEDGEGFFKRDAATNTFVTTDSPGSVILPTVAGHIAKFADTDGTLEDSGAAMSDPTSTIFAMVDALPTVAANIPIFTDTNGTIEDSGVSMEDLIFQNIATWGTTAPGQLSGTGAGPYTWTITGAVSGVSNLLVTSYSTANAVSIIAPTSIVSENTAQVTFSADPGALPQVSYLCFFGDPS